MSGTEVARTWIDAVNRKDVAAFAALYAPNAVLHDPQYPQSLEGKDAIQKDLTDFLQGFPDLHAVVRTVVESGDRYASEGKFTGTHKGPLPTPAGEIPPTGKRIEFVGANFCRLDAQGRILEESRYYDLGGLFAQLEVVV
jgi:steroid delta-isomerase-like uncharacterized protein